MRRRVTLTVDAELFRKYNSLAIKHGVSLSAAMRYGLAEGIVGVDPDGIDPRKELVIVQGSKGQWGTKQTN